MPRFAANLTMQYNEHPFLDRFAAAAADGFTAVEYMFPYDFAKADIRARLDHHGLAQVLFNAPAGNWAAGDRGLAAVPGREAECRAGVDKALDYAAALGNELIHVMAGIGEGEAARAAYVANLVYAADRAAAQGVTIVIEPINRRDMPGFFVDRQADAQAIRAEIGRDNLKILFDCYHAQVAEGDLATKLRRDIAGIGHIQIAGPPARNEPDTGEIDFPYLFGVIDEIGYSGWIGCEYRPAKGTSAGLGWLKRARAAGESK